MFLVYTIQSMINSTEIKTYKSAFLETYELGYDKRINMKISHLQEEEDIKLLRIFEK